VPAYPAEAFRGRLGYIGDILNPETRTITVRTEVKNTGFKLKPGMFADVTIFLNGAQKVLAVPVEAILDDRNEKLVFVKADGQYIPRIVEVGAEYNGYCAILSGLQEGDQVVTKGNYLLKSKLHEDVLKKAGVH
jgi:cobalt-zinc-cadmium efflux system membrane fusion protein